MKVGTKVLLIHALSSWQEAIQVVWVAGSHWRGRRIPESRLGHDYIVLQVEN